MADKNDPQLTSKGMLIWSLGCAGLAAWVYSDLLGLENGTSKSVRVWWLVGVLYENMGFWPAALVFPLLSAIGFALVVKLYFAGR